MGGRAEVVSPSPGSVPMNHSVRVANVLLLLVLAVLVAAQVHRPWVVPLGAEVAELPKVKNSEQIWG